MATDTERILKIIHAVKKHECLWNAQSPEYAKRDKLERAWLAVSQEVGKDDGFCREKWRNVRTGFLRSIQNNVRIVADESSNDFHPMPRKRFYLYDYMQFLLPSALVLEKARKRRRSAKVYGDGDEDSRINSEYSDSTVQDYPTVSSDNENIWDQQHPQVEPEEEEEEKNDSHYQRIIKALEICEGNNVDKTFLNNTQSNQNLFISKVQSSLHKIETPKKNEASSSERPSDYDEREAEEIMNFFKGNIGDILALSKKNQRLFKRKMLEVIEELHDLESISEN